MFKRMKKLKFTILIGLLITVYIPNTSTQDDFNLEEEVDESVDVYSEDNDLKSQKQESAKADAKNLNLVDYKTPLLTSSSVLLYEAFDDASKFNLNWVQSKATKADSQDDKYDGKWELVGTDERIPGLNFFPQFAFDY
jgi:hypothetical protein